MPPVNSRYDIDRRAALKLFAGGLALPLASCGKPHEEIVPYVEMPERVVPGEPLKFATTLPLSGFGRGVLVTSIDGRPIKIEGNPRHPASLGATDVFAEAEIMALYDPSRSKAPRHADDIATWNAFADAWRAQLEREKSRGGSGLYIVTGRITSPTFMRQLGDLLALLPQAKWCAYEALSDDSSREGAVLAYGRPLTLLPRIADASVILALDADPLGPGPRQIANARSFAQRRSRESEPFSRLYSVEPDWSLTGANADHRLALHPDLIRNFGLAVAAYASGEGAPDLPQDAALMAQACAADLKVNKGRALVLVGPRQPPEIHALAHWLNAQLNAPVDFIAPVEGDASGPAQNLQALANDLEAGRVASLIVIDANPAYDTPSELGLADKIKAVSFAAHFGLHDDETAALCQWHLPLSHALESWSDLRAFDGTASIVQPLIRPLYDTRSVHELLALMAGAVAPSAYEIVQQTWRGRAGETFEAWWRQVLHDGVIFDSAPSRVNAGTPKRPDIAPAANPEGLSLLFAADPAVWDGAFANNAWLQECPHPFTKDVWGNAIHLSPADAQRATIADGETVTLTQGNTVLQGPARVRAGQAEGVVSVTLGYGRTRAGAIGNGIGFDAYKLRTFRGPWRRDQVALIGTGERQHLPPRTQSQFKLEGEAKDLYPILSLADLANGARPKDRDESKPTLYPPFDYDTYAWAMVIDTSRCIGCNACVVACQAENNVPVVGPEEAARGRDMHWLRIDRYVPDETAPPGFQPVPCMHCEHAPCEPVCPVAASVHDGEGLNVQVYNRCIGTRFCQANCPYKVRRFNWFGYADGQEYADLGAEQIKAAVNPDVTVRQRGVMEKCTYCVQRISRARRDAEKEDRPIADGAVVTACQAACPTQAITFGDKNNKASRITTLRDEPHHYALLGHLGTRPRTTYLARLRNPNPALQRTPS